MRDRSPHGTGEGVERPGDIRGLISPSPRARVPGNPSALGAEHVCIYIYIYMCVCVCVCARAHMRVVGVCVRDDASLFLCPDSHPSSVSC